ncbi:ATP-binding cassette sub-family G member 1 isoform X5 [Diabrotica virgifera virgifera]|uniref:ATP-binding cassette sub-family G member 1 isoform X4 n=1 Tax=Diabrotica virgifera virgifera TaxID=50390 RepID=A0A6P7FP89_DIAVI|nr:ATP-binding cassette sub-family G member 1 isoform X5 [Diabrotica virgifera virgifera]XP_028136607.1 ATP-binding cassette sub-family G member 1 isoform X5 [Diabrotica virgifera virgifera]XP_050512638.1 ATP-binding cassette sub-family G member 1 isoform X5 [Diabrotica virgifera virgifera]KAI2474077.1 ATP binding cassette (ABC) transporter subfamily G member [Diabrotica virgifera virgifera]KAI2474078.1 ATP binding cassette (ABC) transporter subfamily G member [Diabrotica virgifera virgifera]
MESQENFIVDTLQPLWVPQELAKPRCLIFSQDTILFYRVTGTTGTIKCNSSSRKQKGVLQYKKESCYILQDDSLPNLFTVEECMMIASKLKIANMAKKAREFLINEILTNLSLLKAKNTRCQSLSGGQKKRLSIALELVDNPPILFLDEPTTGLDSASTTQCVDLLKKLANGGRIVICTIHQPNTQTYEMFDQVYMLAKGRCVYQGPSTNTVPFLASVGLHCPQYHNPADYIMEVVSGEYGDHIDQLAVAAQDKKWQNIPTIKLSDTPAIDSKDNNIIYSDENVTLSKSPSEWKRFFILLQRSSVQLYRDWTISQLKLVLHLLVGLFLGITFQNCGRDATKVISNLGFLQVGIVYLAYTSMMPAVLKFPTELVILKKESFNNWYKLTTYYAAFLVFDIPQQMLFSTVYCIGCYFVSDQPLEVDRFFSVLFVLVLASLSSSGFGLILGTITNPINGVFFGAVGLCFFISVGGFFIMFTHMSNVMYLFSYISYISFSVEGVMQAIYGYGRGQLHCPEEAEFCQYVSSEVLLEDIGMSKPNYWIDIIYLTCTFLTFRTIAFVTLKRKLANP